MSQRQDRGRRQPNRQNDGQTKTKKVYRPKQPAQGDIDEIPAEERKDRPQTTRSNRRKDENLGEEVEEESKDGQKKRRNRTQ